MLSLAIPTGVFNPGGLSEDTIYDYVTLARSPGYQSAHVRLLDKNNNPIAITNPSSSVFDDSADVSTWVATGKVTNNTSQTVHRSLDMTMNQIPGFDFNALQHRIEARWAYFDSRHNFLFEAPLGTFQCALADIKRQDAGNVWTISGLDALTRAAQISFINPWTVAANYGFTQAVIDMLTTSALSVSDGGTGQGPDGSDQVGPGFSLAQLNITPCATLVPQPIPWTRKDNMLAAIDAMLSAINYWPLCVNYDASGTPTVQSWPEPYFTATMPDYSWAYSTATNILKPGITQQVANKAALYNVVVVEASNAGNDTFVSIKKNRSPTSSISIDNLGEAVVQYISADTIPDQTTCDVAAFLALQEAALAAETVQFSTAPNPFHQTHDYYLLNVADKAGKPEITSTPTTLFQETQWDLDLIAKVQTHTASRAVMV